VTVLANLEDLADVGVIDRRDRHRFATKALARLRVRGRLLRQQLDRDLALEARVQGTIHDAHPPVPSVDRISYGPSRAPAGRVGTTAV
jgi:hypothetical protein